MPNASNLIICNPNNSFHTGNFEIAEENKFEQYYDYCDKIIIHLILLWTLAIVLFLDKNYFISVYTVVKVKQVTYLTILK